MQSSFFPHLIEFDITYVGICHLNCILFVGWLGDRELFFYEKQCVTL